ncbi:MAG TPA: hypothetical protein DF712_12785 [Balneola sp.]|jgi:hypothetical protein|nr:hypothetical protein [Balneola sp.]|tara:strand:- start:195 stop:437 length:243 start_codon:yes stop_codon:yes gene_type:complete
MFEKCSKIDKVCGFCCVSTYNPDIFKHDDVKKEFCGIAGSYDTRVSSLPNCWLQMTKGQRSTYTKKKADRLTVLQISGRL